MLCIARLSTINLCSVPVTPKERDAAVVRFGSLCHLLSVAASSLGEEARGAQQVLHHLHAAGA
jgi:hypothetical protein